MRRSPDCRGTQMTSFRCDRERGRLDEIAQMRVGMRPANRANRGGGEHHVPDEPQTDEENLCNGHNVSGLSRTLSL
jgi:hypothetical protein